ncbi:MAG: DUF2452 domain-containing protein [Halioglobus sp.]|nr:DUF2452 domain-containing protein [Halioglobus sp.]
MKSAGDTTPKNPNPQGKGIVPVLQDLRYGSAAQGTGKSPIAFFRDYCVSSLVLAAQFNFRPVANREYYLFSTSGGWTLSLVAPAEWRGNAPGSYVAACCMRDDMTWTVDFASLDATDPVRDKLEAHLQAFIETLEGQADIAQALPYYVRELPYYRRVLAAGLAGSLRASMPEERGLKALVSDAGAAARLLAHAAPSPTA